MSETIDNKVEGADATKVQEEEQYKAAMEYLLQPFETDVVVVESLVGNGSYEILAPDFFGLKQK